MTSAFLALVEDDRIDRQHPLWTEAYEGLDVPSIVALMTDHGHLYDIIEDYEDDMMTKDVVTVIDASVVYVGDWKARLRRIREV